MCRHRLAFRLQICTCATTRNRMLLRPLPTMFPARLALPGLRAPLDRLALRVPLDPQARLVLRGILGLRGRQGLPVLRVISAQLDLQGQQAQLVRLVLPQLWLGLRGLLVILALQGLQGLLALLLTAAHPSRLPAARRPSRCLIRLA